MTVPIGRSTRSSHAGIVKSGKLTVYIYAVAMLSAATVAGRVGEDGTGAMWIAPELLEPAASITANCGQPTRIQTVDVKFEILELGDVDERADRLADNHEAVDFEWNPASSELSYRTSSRTSVFNDLALPSVGESALAASCGSR